MLSLYTTRDLSFDEDILKAFSGVLNRKFKGATTYGLPCEAFDRAIFWETNNYTSPSRASKSESLFPSWSWTSTFGRIRFVDGYGIAFWGMVNPTPGSNGELTYMVPSPEYQKGYGFFDKHGHGLSCGLAWPLGCVSEEHPPGLEFDCSAKEYENRLHAKWKSYTDYWTDAFGSFLNDGPFSEAEVEAAGVLGRLLVYTHEATFSIEWIARTDKDSPGKQYFIIKSKDGSLAGLIFLGVHQKEKLGTAVYDSARFIALSVSLDSGNELKPTVCQKCDSYFVSEFWLESSECHCERRDTAASPQSSVLKKPKRTFPPDIYFLDQNGDPVPGWEPVMLNVMLVHSVSGNKGDEIVQRLGIGKIYLKKWAQAERQFRTFILE